MANKTRQILDFLESDENLTQREIAKRVGCTEGYVSTVKRKANIDSQEEQPGNTEIIDPNDEELEAETSNFVKKVKIIPPKEVLTDTEEVDEDEEYECGSCGATWSAAKKEYQTKCPECGQEF